MDPAAQPIDPNDDRRLFQRFTARFPTKFKDSRQDFGMEVFLRDVSGTGIRLVTKDRMYINDNLSLEIELPDGREPLALNGQVVWSRTMDGSMWDVGLQFHKIQLLKLHRLFQYSL